MYFLLAILIYSIYLYFLPGILSKFYLYKFQDINLVLNKYLIFAFAGYLVILLLMLFLVQKGKFQKRSFIILLVSLAAMIVAGYYYFIDTALNLVSWINV